VSHQLLNTIIVAALTILIGVTAAALGAYAFSQLRFRGKELLFVLYVALLLVPWTLTLIPLFLTIQKLHFFNTWWALILPYAASAQPLLVLIFRGFFEKIPRELLESARVDGCAERQVLARIVVPLTRPVLLTGAILVMINVWGDYLWPSIVIQDPAKITISAGVQQFVGSLGLNTASGGAVFAAFVLATAPMFVLVGFTMRYFVSGLTEGASKL
jgi:ABC-type glycerol-3-phosphate transport system permease component